jgi:aldose 1-epimerase
LESKLHQISNEEITLEIDVEHGARVSSLKWKSFEFVLPKREDPMSWGWFAMVPWAGRIKLGKIQDADGMIHQLPTHWDPPHAEHGYGFHSEWSAIDENSFELALPAPYSPAIARQSFVLVGNTLKWSLEYISNGCTLPAWVGFHPWFQRTIDSNSELELNFEAEKALVRGSDYMPTGEYSSIPDQPWDDAFTGLKSDPSLTWGDKARIEISSDVPWWVVYTEDQLGICVEPQTAPPDAANLGIAGSHSISALFIFS